MPEKKAFYGFGNYLTDEGATLGSTMIFVLADDESAARALLIREIYIGGEPVPGSLKVCSGSEIRVDWLMAAAMQSDESAWSSGVSVPTVMRATTTQKKRYLN